MQGSKQTSIPKPLAYVSGDLFDAYLHDMKIVQEYAEWNRKSIMDEIVKGMKLHVVEQFTTIHNYIDLDAMILRKGSKAKESFTVSEFKKQMKGIYTTSVNAETLDECPMAYKSMKDIVDCIEDTVCIQQVIKPIYNFKAGEQ